MFYKSHNPFFQFFYLRGISVGELLKSKIGHLRKPKKPGALYRKVGYATGKVPGARGASCCCLRAMYNTTQLKIWEHYHYHIKRGRG